MRSNQLMPISRRSFLGGLASVGTISSRSRADDSRLPSRIYRQTPPPISAPDQVLNVMEFEPLARDALPPAHFGYIATGSDDDLTVARNHDAYLHYEIRAHRFSDLSHLDMTRTVFGVTWPSPIYLSAVSAMRAFHAEGELAVARAARTRNMQMMLSTGSSTAPESVAEARGAPLWQQLYPTDDWDVTTAVVRRADKAGCTAIVLTVDSHGTRNNETLKRAMRADNRVCTGCHVNNSHDLWRRAPVFNGIDVARVTGLAPADLTVVYLDRLRAQVKGKLIVKGIVTGEDAALAVAHGADGIVVSNHGGRNEETLRAPIDCLAEVVAAVQGRVPVFVDGGIRRGTDVFKAIALGATAVGIGRPQVWGLAAFGQPGVEAVIDIYARELAAIMRQAGTPTLESINGSTVVHS
jgi:isopentenyl diphosphate isomerase/L-lactate dehydrogenase-like FMN-dependent dehydrogenase